MVRLIIPSKSLCDHDTGDITVFMTGTMKYVVSTLIDENTSSSLPMFHKNKHILTDVSLDHPDFKTQSITSFYNEFKNAYYMYRNPESKFGAVGVFLNHVSSMNTSYQDVVPILSDFVKVLNNMYTPKSFDENAFDIVVDDFVIKRNRTESFTFNIFETSLYQMMLICSESQYCDPWYIYKKKKNGEPTDIPLSISSILAYVEVLSKHCNKYKLDDFMNLSIYDLVDKINDTSLEREDSNKAYPTTSHAYVDKHLGPNVMDIKRQQNKTIIPDDAVFNDNHKTANGLRHLTDFIGHFKSSRKRRCDVDVDVDVESLPKRQCTDEYVDTYSIPDIPNDDDDDEWINDVLDNVYDVDISDKEPEPEPEQDQEPDQEPDWLIMQPDISDFDTYTPSKHSDVNDIDWNIDFEIQVDNVDNILTVV